MTPVIRSAHVAERARRSVHRVALPLLLLALPASTLPAFAQDKSDPDEAKALVGRWGYSAETDKETGEVETTVIEFLPDGRYVTTVRSNVFPDQAKRPLARGRYAVADADKGGLTLLLDREPGDPEDDKADAKTKVRLVRVGDDSLRADDGSVAKRLK